MIKKIKNILEGWYNSFRKVPPAQDALFRARLQICQSNECGKLKLGICTECGCPVKKKTKALDEDCPLNMWKPMLYMGDYFDVMELPEETKIEFLWWAGNNQIRIIDSMCAWEHWLEFKNFLREQKL